MTAGLRLGPEYDWQLQALCAERKPNPQDQQKHADRFFPQSRPSPTFKARCQGCPVRQECLDHALRYSEPGIWGGTTEKERKLMAQPKEEVA